ncbi:MAG: hypothetical protein ABSC19_08735 [Syntrophorhabdales bacterium]
MIVVGELHEVKQELKADLFGLCACPGEAEGVVHVLLRRTEGFAAG